MARQRLTEPVQPRQPDAAAVEGLRMVGLERDRVVVARHRFSKPVQSRQCIAAVVVRKGGSVIYRQSPVDLTDRLSIVAALKITQTEQVQAVKMLGLRLQDLL